MVLGRLPESALWDGVRCTMGEVYRDLQRFARAENGAGVAALFCACGKEQAGVYLWAKVSFSEPSQRKKHRGDNNGK